jgi:nitrite reductase (NADH) large subunit
MKKPRLVMVGNGMAGVRTLEELLKIAPDLYDITVFGAEPHPNYNRILLSPVLAGEQTLDEIILNDWSWYTENGIHLHAGCTVDTVDRVRRVVHATDAAGAVISAEYDRLILATGSNPFILPIAGHELDGVLAYRDIADTQAMIDAAATYKHAVVIGGGLLGLEAANGLMKRGMQVTVVHASEWLMERQLDSVAGKMLQKSLAERGMQFLMQAQTAALLGNDTGRVCAVQFKDGTEVPADLVVMAVGIRPNTALAEKMRLHVNRGIVVSDTLQTTTDARIYAVGECAAHRGIAYGLVAPLFEQGRVLANHLAEFGIGRYQGSLTSTKLKVTGIDLFSAGDFQGGAGTEEIVMSDPSAGVYKKLVLKDDKLVGACLYGDTVDGSWYFKLLRDARPVGDIRDKLMFGESNMGDAGHQGHNKAAAMLDTDEVCGCNGVTKGTICKAIKEKGLFTLDEVRKHTKASASCGSCTGLVEQILMFTAGGDYSQTPKTKPLCGCTEHGHQAVRDAIRTHKLLSTGAVFRFMDWKTPNGCPSCRPAINYYLHQHLAQRGAGRPAKPRHQRAQPRQHPERRHVFRGAAHVGRRDHGRRAAPHRRRGGQIPRFPPSRSRAASASTCWASKRKTCRPSGRTLACPAATPTPRRCAPSKPAWAASGAAWAPRTAPRWARTWSAPLWACTHRTRSSSPSAAARATAPRAASRTWASSAWTAAGRCTWRATAASRPRWRSSSSSSRPPRKSWSTPAPSCSSTARKPGTWSAPCTTWRVSAWIT